MSKAMTPTNPDDILYEPIDLPQPLPVADIAPAPQGAIGTPVQSTTPNPYEWAPSLKNQYQGIVNQPMLDMQSYHGALQQNLQQSLQQSLHQYQQNTHQTSSWQRTGLSMEHAARIIASMMDDRGMIE